MKLVPLYKMSNEAFGKPDVDLLYERILRFQYVRERKLWRSAIRFDGVSAIQIRAHSYLDDWQDETFYELVEVLDSPWKAHMMSLVSDGLHSHHDAKRHYAILSDNDGYEFLADSWKLLPEKEGWDESGEHW